LGGDPLLIIAQHAWRNASKQIWRQLDRTQPLELGHFLRRRFKPHGAGVGLQPLQGCPARQFWIVRIAGLARWWRNNEQRIQLGDRLWRQLFEDAGVETIVVGRKGRPREPVNPIRGRRFDLECATTSIHRGFEAFEAPVMGREEVATQPDHKFLAILGRSFAEVKQVADLPSLVGGGTASPLKVQITAGRNV
jgi:hypothetical protein